MRLLTLFLAKCLFLCTCPSANATTLMTDSFSIRTEATFYSSHQLVRGWVYWPANKQNQKVPVIVMAPGFSGVKESGYEFYAAQFSKAGFAVLLFDYPNTGASEGLIRDELDPSAQVQAYRDGISYMATLPEVDAMRIGIWGGSYSGGHVLVVSALDQRVKCLVAMTPFVSGNFYCKNMPAASKDFLIAQFNADRLTRVKGGKPITIPVVSDIQTQFCAIPGKNAWNFVESFKANAPNFTNRVTLKSLEMQLEYEPMNFMANTGAIPKLFIVANEDEMIPESLILEAYNKATEPKQVQYISGQHFSPYMEQQQAACDLAIVWFQSNL